MFNVWWKGQMTNKMSEEKEDKLTNRDLKILRHLAKFTQFYELEDYAHDWVLFHKTIKEWYNYMSKHYDDLNSEQCEAAMTYFFTRADKYRQRLKQDPEPNVSSNNRRAMNFIDESNLEIQYFDDYAEVQNNKSSSDDRGKFGRMLFKQSYIADKYQSYAWSCSSNATNNFQAKLL